MAEKFRLPGCKKKFLLKFFFSFSFFFFFQVKDVEDQLSQRKAEVEKLIQEMREVNMESLAISPPEESKQFLDGNLSHSTIKLDN